MLVGRERYRDVLRHRQIVEQRKMLKHHPDAERGGVIGTVQRDEPTLPADIAGIGGQQPIEDLDERRFARAVLAEQRVDFPANRSRSMRSLAVRSPKRFTIPRRRTSGTRPSWPGHPYRESRPLPCATMLPPDMILS
jgi:hypothetical protein